MKKYFIILLGVILLSSCGLLLYSPCEDGIKLEIKSANGEFIATVYERNCGATVDYSTIVNLRRKNAKFDGDKDVIFVVKGQEKVEIEWQRDNNLLIKCAGCNLSAIFKQEKKWNTTNIDYRL